MRRRAAGTGGFNAQAGLAQAGKLPIWKLHIIEGNFAKILALIP
jgi:hypothetical protein